MGQGSGQSVPGLCWFAVKMRQMVTLGENDEKSGRVTAWGADAEMANLRSKGRKGRRERIERIERIEKKRSV